jgi:hypothetical protein
VADYKAKLEAGMRKLAAAQRRDYEARRRGEDTYVSDLNVNDLAAVIAELLREQKSDIVQHVHRLMKLVEIHQHDEDTRAKKLAMRVFHLESEIRQIKRKAP